MSRFRVIVGHIKAEFQQNSYELCDINTQNYLTYFIQKSDRITAVVIAYFLYKPCNSIITHGKILPPEKSWELMGLLSTHFRSRKLAIKSELIMIINKKVNYIHLVALLNQTITSTTLGTL